jgi:hypothetical protein
MNFFFKCPAPPSLHLETKEIEHDLYKGFLWKKKGCQKSPDFMEKNKFWNCRLLNNTRLQADCQKYTRILKKILLSSLTCSQNWLNSSYGWLPVCGYTTKLAPKKKNPWSHPFVYLNSENPQKLWLHTTLLRKTEWGHANWGNKWMNPSKEFLKKSLHIWLLCMPELYNLLTLLSSSQGVVREQRIVWV